MQSTRSLNISLVALVAVAVVSACAPGQAPTAPASDNQRDEAQRAPKILTLGIVRELDAWNTDLIRVTRAGGIQFLNSIAHNRLTVAAGRHSTASSYASSLTIP